MKARIGTALAAIAAIGIAGVLPGCSTSSGGSAWAQVSAEFEGSDFALPDVPLDQLVQDAEIAVVGEFGEVIGERELAADYVYVQIELIVKEVIAGDVNVDDVLTFEGWTNEVTEVPQGEMLLFLDEKISEVDPPGLWIWHTSRGIWAETDRAEVDTPIAEDPPAESPLYRDGTGDASTLAEVIDLAEAAAP